MPTRKKKSKKLLKTGQIVYVEWDDHCSGTTGKWRDVKDFVHEVCICKTVGFVVLDTESYLTLALTFQIDDEVMSQTMTIVKSCIYKMVPIKVE